MSIIRVSYPEDKKLAKMRASQLVINYENNSCNYPNCCGSDTSAVEGVTAVRFMNKLRFGSKL